MRWPGNRSCGGEPVREISVSIERLVLYAAGPAPGAGSGPGHFRDLGRMIEAALQGLLIQRGLPSELETTEASRIAVHAGTIAGSEEARGAGAATLPRGSATGATGPAWDSGMAHSVATALYDALGRRS